jgi:uncharacterized protein (TIGR02246 family)
MTEVQQWVDKLAIREVIERYMRYNDDGNADAIIELFDADATFQFFGRVIKGRDAIYDFFVTALGTTRQRWTDEGGLFVQPRSIHLTANPVIDIDGDHATAESDFLVVDRNDDGRSVVSWVGRFRDRFRRVGDDGAWLIECRTGISVARPGEAGTDSEWKRAIERMPEDMKAQLRRA